MKRIIDNHNAILHGGDYNPDQWLDRPDILEEDFRLMKLSGCNTFSLGIFAWTTYEPEEGVYQFDWLDNMMDRMADAGYKVILATPSGSKPAWLSTQYPEIRKVDVNGLREPHRTRHNHCWTSPLYRKKVQALNEALAERYQNHPALAMWHISNEYGTACYCDLCLTDFQQWLKKKYGTLEELNRRYWATFWNHTFTDWNQVDPRDESMDALRTDWDRYHTDHVMDFYQAECEPLNRITPDIPKTTNLMGFYVEANYWKFSKILDVIADDSYPCLERQSPDLWKGVADLTMTHSLMRALAKPKDRPWFLIESSPSNIQWRPSQLKAPGVHQAEALQAIAQGGEGVMYFQWRKGSGGCEKFHGAIVDHEGTENTRVFKEVAEVGHRFTEMTDLLGSEVPTAQVALIYDWESRWSLKNSSGMMSHNMLWGNGAGYNPEPHYRELWRRSIATDLISVDHDFSAYKLIVAPQLFMLKPGIGEKIREFIKQGGTFVGTYYLGYVNEDGACFPGGWPGEGLREVFGVWNEEYDLVLKGEQKSIRFGKGDDVVATGVCEMLHAEGAEVLAEYAEDFYEGNPAVTKNSFGKGNAFYIGTEVAEEGMHSVYDQITDTAGISVPTLFVDKPDTVAVCLRENKEIDESFVFVTNWSPKGVEVELAGQAITPFGSDKAMSGTLSLQPFECLCGQISPSSI